MYKNNDELAYEPYKLYSPWPYLQNEQSIPKLNIHIDKTCPQHTRSLHHRGNLNLLFVSRMNIVCTLEQIIPIVQRKTLWTYFDSHMLIEKVITLLRYYYNIWNIASYTRVSHTIWCGGGTQTLQTLWLGFCGSCTFHVYRWRLGAWWRRRLRYKQRRDRGARTVLLNCGGEPNEYVVCV